MNIIKKFLTIITLTFIFSCHSEPKITSKANIKLYVFECGDIIVKNVEILSPGYDSGVPKHLTDSCYLIKHPKGLLLWDTGLDDKIGKKGIKVYEGLFELKVKKPLMAQLEEIHVKPEDITYVAFSYFHQDHTGNANNFYRSTILIQKNEYKVAFGNNPERYGFNPDSYEKLKDSKIIKLKGDFDVFGDKSVIIKSTPGHQSLFVDLPKTGPVVISGDLYHFTKNKEFHRIPKFNTSPKQTLKSMIKLDKFTAEKKAQLWIQHDLEQNQTIKHSPKFYN